MSDNVNAVSVKGIYKNYGDVEALRDMSLDFPKGQLTSLLGPSGCGKTTLLKIIAGLLQPNQGEVYVNGQIVSEPGPDRAFVFQDFALMPWASVLRNVAFGLELRKVAKIRKRRYRPKVYQRGRARWDLRIVILMNYQEECVKE
jgi:NitT/TauT family transport system ATP-binding protein